MFHDISCQKQPLKDTEHFSLKRSPTTRRRFGWWQRTMCTWTGRSWKSSCIRPSAGIR